VLLFSSSSFSLSSSSSSSCRLGTWYHCFSACVRWGWGKSAFFASLHLTVVGFDGFLLLLLLFLLLLLLALSPLSPFLSVGVWWCCIICSAACCLLCFSFFSFIHSLFLLWLLLLLLLLILSTFCFSLSSCGGDWDSSSPGHSRWGEDAWCIYLPLHHSLLSLSFLPYHPPLLFHENERRGKHDDDYCRYYTHKTRTKNTFKLAKTSLFSSPSLPPSLPTHTQHNTSSPLPPSLPPSLLLYTHPTRENTNI